MGQGFKGMASALKSKKKLGSFFHTNKKAAKFP
jgi:hypothetical protein